MSARARLRPVLVEARRELKRWSYVDLDHSLGATTLLAGSGRSGTTWLGEILDRHHDHRVIFEPLRASLVPAVAHFAHSQYIRPGDDDPRWVDPVERILRGRLRNRWADHQNHVHVARRRLVKEIRANNLLKWVKVRFPEVRVVWIVRHPGAVAVSALALGWRHHLDDLLAQPDLVADHLEPLLPAIEAAHTPFERFVAQWCIETLVPFRMLGPSDACLVFYEELCLAPVAESTRVLAAVGQQVDAALAGALDRPSKLARDDSAVRRGEDLVTGWTTHVDDADLRGAAALLDAFGLSEVYSTDPVPDGAAGRRLLARPWSPSDG